VSGLLFNPKGYSEQSEPEKNNLELEVDMQQQFRQGDVMLTKIDGLPQGQDSRHLNTKTVAAGEATGHNHVLQGEAVTLFRENGWGPNQPAFAVIGANGATLVHEEHGAIRLEPGVYRITHQREYDPLHRDRRIWD
jgi:hypothetical protein